MQLLTPTNISHSVREITYEDKCLLLGSCFSENMLIKFEEAYMRVKSNPFGVLYNPLSIGRIIEVLLSHEDIQTLPIINHNGLWHSMLHHGDFSKADKQEFENGIEKSKKDGKSAIEEATVVIVTFGTAWVYETDGQIVGNCHKLPADRFNRRRLSVSDIVEQWQRLLSHKELKDKHFIFTVSPIRHLKDGLHENQLSKSVLLLAVDKIVSRLPDRCSYFPSYELLIDELRDYRFYADDMLHPSALAINYIWERFCETYFSKQTLSEMKPLLQLYRNLHHRPLHTDSEEYRRFACATENQRQILKRKYPWI